MIQQTATIMAATGDRKIKGLAAQARRLALQRLQQDLRDIQQRLSTFEDEENGDPAPPALDGLDERDLELIRLVCHKANYSWEYMAVLMKIPLPTLHHVRKKVFAFFGVHSKIELVRLLDEQDGQVG